MPVDTIDTAIILRVLEPIWTSTPVTASRVRGRIESILSYSIAHKWRDGPNPARWEALKNLLVSPKKAAKPQGHAALSYAAVAPFMAAISEDPSVAGWALQFLTLTAARSGEVLGMRWDEVNLDARIWTVPAARMKGGVEHRVPLAPQAITLLERAQEFQKNEFVWPGDRAAGLPKTALLDAMRKVEPVAVPHGLRATFRTWAGEETAFPHDVIERSLAHITGNQVEKAYARGDLIDKRRALMAAWSDYCLPGGAP
jgi:integrase